MPQQGKLGKDLALSLHYGNISLVGQCRKNHILAICATSPLKVLGWPSAAPSRDHLGV